MSGSCAFGPEVKVVPSLWNPSVLRQKVESTLTKGFDVSDLSLLRGRKVLAVLQIII